MNREAAALGVPVYSIFRGKSGAVDRYLSAAGRLVFIENPQDVNRIRFVRREPPSRPNPSEQHTLASIVDQIITTVELVCHRRLGTNEALRAKNYHLN